ncbi:MAG: type II toxin-antitoxin system HicA family toxin [Dehalococcoidia bacterium]
MKRKDLVQHLNKHNCRILREGKKHSIYYNLLNFRTSTVPRHREINDFTVNGICRDLGVPFLK